MVVKYLLLHHTSVAGKNSLTAIRKDHKKRYGRTFYNVIIDKQGNVHYEHNKLNYRGKNKRSMDVCLTGDFTKEEPNEAQLKSLKLELKKLYKNHNFKAVITHNRASSYRLLASKSRCPGSLGNYINAIMEQFYGQLVKDPTSLTKIYFVRRGYKHHVVSGEVLKTIWKWEAVGTMSHEKFNKLKEGPPIGYLSKRSIINWLVKRLK